MLLITKSNGRHGKLHYEQCFGQIERTLFKEEMKLLGNAVLLKSASSRE